MGAGGKGLMCSMEDCERRRQVGLHNICCSYPPSKPDSTWVRVPELCLQQTMKTVFTDACIIMWEQEHIHTWLLCGSVRQAAQGCGVAVLATVVSLQCLWQWLLLGIP